ncbi:DC-STAMP-like protein [Dictyocaulus viviparus]|uniref:DC-STAMP-like protein n=1 Tax=Dictyocaulus viviparus TaxID=29172 RepID=A0A0D8XN85_DICVI|nr:DC-STAMP-like protein [Dictyocaulus viviparus]
MKRRIESIAVCKQYMSKAGLSNTMETDMNEVVNLTDTLDIELQANLHMMLVEMPRLENVFQVGEMKMFVSIGVTYVKIVLRSAKQIVQALFVFYVYVIFRDSVQLIENYQTNVDFNNCFITSVFWQIDHHREMLGQQAIRFISAQERADLKLMNVFSKPTKDELMRAKTSLITWFVTTVAATLIIILDYYFYAFLNAVVSASHTKIEQFGSSSAAVDVEGDGIVAKFIRAMVAGNRTIEMDSTMSNAHCLLPPQRPNLQHIVTWIAIPLLLSLMLQVIFAFVVKRVVINHFLPFMFPLRDRVRIIHLYNKNSTFFLWKMKHRSEARARIRFCVARWKINEENDEGGWLSYSSWFKLNVLDRLFKTGQCLMCQTQR